MITPENTLRPFVTAEDLADGEITLDNIDELTAQVLRAFAEVEITGTFSFSTGRAFMGETIVRDYSAVVSSRFFIDGELWLGLQDGMFVNVNATMHTMRQYLRNSPQG